MTALVRCEIERGVAVVTRDNPPLNLSTRELTRQLHDCLIRVAADPQVRVVVMAAAGTRAFGAGSDITEFPAYLEAGDVVERKMSFENDTLALLEGLAVPTVAAMSGLAYGGGLEIALCCDFLVAERGSSVALPEVRLGVIPGGGAPIRLTRRVGEARAMEMMLLGAPVPTEVAAQWGLLSRLVEPGTALDSSLALAAELAALPSEALRACKRAIRMASPAAAPEVRATEPLFGQVFQTQDAREGVQAFLEGRPAEFRHC